MSGVEVDVLVSSPDVVVTYHEGLLPVAGDVPGVELGRDIVGKLLLHHGRVEVAQFAFIDGVSVSGVLHDHLVFAWKEKKRGIEGEINTHIPGNCNILLFKYCGRNSGAF